MRKPRRRPALGAEVSGSSSPLFRKQQVATLVVGLCCVAAACISPILSAPLRYVNADTIIGVFVSLDRWTPFFWGQGRLGMLVPALAMPIRDAFWNFVFQGALQMGSLWLACGLAAHLITRESRSLAGWIGHASLAMALLIPVLRTTAKGAEMFFLPGHPYLISIPLILAAVLYGSRGGMPLQGASLAGFGFFAALALWVSEANLIVLALLIPLVWLRLNGPLRLRLRRILWLGLILVLLRLAIGWLSERFGGGLPWKLAPLENLPQVLTHELFQTFQMLVSPWAALPMIGVAAILAFRSGGLARVAWVCFAGASAVMWVVTSLSWWVEANLYDVRYWTLPLLLLVVPSTAMVAGVIWRRGSALLPVAPLVACVVLLLVMTVRFGPPWPGRARDALHETLGAHDADFAELGCTHVIGGYWPVWTMAFYRRTSGLGPLFPVTDRSESDPRVWNTLPEGARVYCALCGDGEVSAKIDAFRLPVKNQSDKSGAVCRLR